MRKNFYEADRETQIAVLVNSPSDLEKGLQDPYANWTYNRYIPDKSSVEKIHSLNKKVFIVGSSHIISDWKAGAEQAKEAGVDAVLTDYPLEWQKAIHLKKL
jgi:glycerophosphoryl diester phosphodiesterase